MNNLFYLINGEEQDEDASKEAKRRVSKEEGEDSIGPGWTFIIFLIILLIIAAFWCGFNGKFMSMDRSSPQKLYNDEHVCEQTFYSWKNSIEARIMLIQPEALSDGWRQASAEEMKKIFEDNVPRRSFNQIILSSTTEPGEFSIPRFICVRYVNSFAVELESVPVSQVKRDSGRFMILAIKDKPEDQAFRLTTR